VANAIPGRVSRANHASTPTSSLYGRVAISSISSCEVEQSGRERWAHRGRGIVTVVASRRLKQARMESMNASWEIAIVRGERSRSNPCRVPFDLSRASNAILHVKTLRGVIGLLPRPYRDAVVHPESCCGGIVARPGVLIKSLDLWLLLQIRHSPCEHSAPRSTSFRLVPIRNGPS